MKPVLKIFIAEHCSTCNETIAIAIRIKHDYPDIGVEIIDIGDAQVTVPEAVFAIPTIMLNDRIVSLGTPHPAEIVRWVEEAIAHHPT